SSPTQVCAALGLNQQPRTLQPQIFSRHQLRRATPEWLPSKLWGLLLGATSRIFSWVLVRALRISVWLLVLLLNAFCFSLHSWGLETAIDSQGGLQVSGIIGSLLSALSYNGLVAQFLTIITLLRLIVEDIWGFHLEIGNHLPYAQLLWTPLRILSDWWHDLLLSRGFFHTILDGPRDVVVCPRKAELNDFGAGRRLLFFLDDNSFAVLAISVYVSCLFSFLPYLIGISVLNFPLIDNIGFVSNSSPIFTGYSVMVAISVEYLVMKLASIDMLRQLLLYISLAPFILLYGLLAPLFRNPLNVVNEAIQFLSRINYKLLICPLLLGFHMDFCTIPVTGTSYSRKIEFVSGYPLCILIHWFCGYTWLVLSSAFMRLIYKIIGGQRASWFLEDVTDINKLHYAQFLAAFAFQEALIFSVVHLPTDTISLVSSSFFPLHFWVYDTRILFGSVAAYGFLVRVGVHEWLAELIGASVEPIVRMWITTVSSWLQWMQTERFVLREGVMLFLAALSMYLVSLASMVLPVLVGRVFFQLISFAKQDDLYGFCIGCVLLRSIFKYNHIWTWIGNGIMNSSETLLVLLVDIIVIIPSLVPQDETPGFFSVQDRLIGLAILHIWTYLTVFTRINRFQNVAWRERLQRIRGGIIYRFSSKYSSLLLGLVLETGLTTICFPLLVAGPISSSANLLCPVVILGLGFVAKVAVESVYLDFF
ncbi:BnaAnng33150D, partial [Brassica napus]